MVWDVLLLESPLHKQHSAGNDPNSCRSAGVTRCVAPSKHDLAYGPAGPEVTSLGGDGLSCLMTSRWKPDRVATPVAHVCEAGSFKVTPVSSCVSHAPHNCSATATVNATAARFA